MPTLNPEHDPLPKFANGLCVQLEKLGLPPSKRVGAVDAISGTMRIAFNRGYEMGRAKAIVTKGRGRLKSVYE